MFDNLLHKQALLFFKLSDAKLLLLGEAKIVVHHFFTDHW